MPAAARLLDPRSEHEIQRAIVATLRGWGVLVHHSNNNAGGGGKAARVRGGILKGLGVHAGFPDLTCIAWRGDRLDTMLLEVKRAKGRVEPHQVAFGAMCLSGGLPWAVVRSEAEAVEAMRAAGFKMKLGGGV